MASGILPSTSPVVVVFQDYFKLPMTATLKSSNVARLVEFSTDGGIEYFTPTYDKTSSTMIAVISNSRLTHLRFTGAAGDTWSIL